jgi:hypothetical protein
MGESKGGGGGARRATTANVATYIRTLLKEEQREPAGIFVDRLSENLFQVRLAIHGEPEEEAFIFHLTDDPGKVQKR